MPHNSMLGLWAFSGPFGFTGLMASLVVVAIFLAARSYSGCDRSRMNESPPSW